MKLAIHPYPSHSGNSHVLTSPVLPTHTLFSHLQRPLRCRHTKRAQQIDPVVESLVNQEKKLPLQHEQRACTLLHRKSAGSCRQHMHARGAHHAPWQPAPTLPPCLPQRKWANQRSAYVYLAVIQHIVHHTDTLMTLALRKQQGLCQEERHSPCLDCAHELNEFQDLPCIRPSCSYECA